MAFSALEPNESVSTLRWPVWRVSFDAVKRSVTVTELDSVDLSDRKPESRIGFLLERWVQSIRVRRQTAPQPVPAPAKPVSTLKR